MKQRITLPREYIILKIANTILLNDILLNFIERHLKETEKHSGVFRILVSNFEK